LAFQASIGLPGSFPILRKAAGPILIIINAIVLSGLDGQLRPPDVRSYIDTPRDHCNATRPDPWISRLYCFVRRSAGEEPHLPEKKPQKLKRDTDNHRIRTCAGEPSRFRVCLLNHSDRLPRSYDLMPQGIYQHSRSSSAAHSRLRTIPRLQHPGRNCLSLDRKRWLL
jgi:hypothetical protein